MAINRRDLLKAIGGAAIGSAVVGATGCKSNQKPTRMVEKVGSVPNVPSYKDYNDTFFVKVDQDKCEGCDTCVEVCGTKTIDGKVAGGKNSIDKNAECMNCGQCIVSCPYGAVYENVSFVDEVIEKLKDPDVTVVAMPAPAVRYAIGEPFGYKAGTYVGGKMWTALEKLGFNYKWDTEFAADLTIMEEGTELIHRVTGKKKDPLPQFTSCCPAWIKYTETYYPDLMPNLSSCKSPVAMQGALSKTYGAKKTKTDPKKMYTVSIMPCTAKKYEGLRPEMNASHERDIDATITTRELAYMIKKAGINFKTLSDSKADPYLGQSTGAATIFGVTGGVMEAALRLAYEEITGTTLKDVNLKAVRGMQGVRAATIKLPQMDVKVCVVNGLSNAKQVCDEIRAGKSPYHFIEVMNCPGGCVNGGGQPLNPDLLMTDAGFIKQKASSIMRTLKKISMA